MVGIGLVGYGSIGRTHARAIAECPRADVVAVCRRAGERPDDLAGDVAVFTQLGDLASHAEVDVVCVCTPSGLHATQALEAISHGKHVVVEKPLAVRPADAREVVRAAQAQSVSLAVISQRRFEPAARAIKQVVDSGALGRPVLGEALMRWHRGAAYYDQAAWRGTAADDGGALMNQGIHLVDLLRWFMGPVADVAGVVGTLIHDIEAEDTAVASLRFKSGGLGVIAVTTATRPGSPGEVNLFYERGCVGLTESGITRWDVPGVPAPDAAAGAASGAADPTAIGTLGHVRQWRDIIESLEAGRAPSVDGHAGLAALEIVNAVYESDRIGAAVRL